MKLLDERCRPSKAVSRDVTRPHLQNAWLDTQAKRLLATNGMMAVSVPVEVAPRDQTGHVPLPALKALQSGLTLVCRKGLVVAGELLFRRRQELGGSGRANPLADVKVRESIFPKRVRGQAGTVSVGVNPEFLVELAKAMGARNGVVLTFDPEQPTDPIVVTANGGYGDEEDVTKAVLMPMRFDTPEKRR